MLRPLIRPIVRPLVRRVTEPGYGAHFDYYVDSVNGNDANDGRSMGAAFETLAAVGAVVAAGESIGLARGSSWRERLTITDDRVRVGAYGEGARPIIDCSDVVAAVSWSKTGGYTNVYQAALTVDVSADATEWPALWVDGSRMPVVASLATLDATPGSIYHGSVEGSTSITLYVHAPASSDPTSDGKVYEAAIRSAGIDFFDAEYCSVRGVHTKRNYTSYGSLTLGRYCVATDCLAEDGNTHNILLRAFAQAVDCTAKNAYNHTTGPTLFVAFEKTPPANCTYTFTRCRAENATYLGTGRGYYNHSSSGTADSIRYVDCEAHNVQIAFASAKTTVLETVGGSITNCFAPFDVNGVNVDCSGGLLVRDTVVSGHWGNFTGDGITVTIDGADAIFNTTGYLRPLSAGQVVALKNCRIESPNSVLRATRSDVTLVCTDNEFIPAGRMSTIWDFTTFTPTVICDRNNYGGATGKWVYGGVDYLTLAALQSGTGQDLNSVA